jgi:hypothetical protein
MTQPPVRNSSYIDLVILLFIGVGVAVIIAWALQSGLQDKEAAHVDWKPILGSVPMVAGSAKWLFDKLKIVWAVAQENKENIKDLTKFKSEQQEKITELTQKTLWLEVQVSTLYDRVDERNDRRDR